MVYVALLRGINVGGNRKIDMQHLKATFERNGMNEVHTYINSGNVIFQSDEIERERLARILESGIEAEFGFPVRIILRDAVQMGIVVDALPDSWVDGKEAKCDVMFLTDEIDSPEILNQFVIKPGIDDVRYIPGAVLWYVERSKVTRSGLLRIVGTELYSKMTIRNCNTVRKLHAMMSSAIFTNDK